MKRFVFCPGVSFCILFSFTAALAQTAGWQEFIFREAPATRFVAGIWFNERIYAGTHNPGSIYEFSIKPLGAELKRTFFPDSEAPVEAVLDLISFRGELFAVVEKSPSEIRRLNRATGVWEAVSIPVREGYYFATIFQEQMFVSGGVPKHRGLTVFRSAEGRIFEESAQLPDWAWVPVVYQDQIYFLGHRGAAYTREGTAAFRSSAGSRFERVAALEGDFQYQCAYAWRGALYLGIGGWTTAREAKNRAQVYCFDGTQRELVLAGIGMNGITSLNSCGRYLYALADSGWESQEGLSALYRTTDGKDWERVRTFPHPEMRRIEIVAGKNLLLFGGKNREYGVVYLHEDFCE
jgi:hypothetical protein